MKRVLLLAAAAGIAGLLALAADRLRTDAPPAWNDAELAILRSLWIGSLPPVPPAPSNAVADDPRAATLGQRLFFDPRMSGNGAVSCATCHQPARRFTDGRQKALAIGEAKRNTRSIVGAAYSPWQYWDGRKDSLWSQALAPLEDPVEHGTTRMQVARLLSDDAGYRRSYEAIFGPLPDLTDRSRFPERAAPAGAEETVAAWQRMAPGDRHIVNETFSNVGKALAAYERLLVPGPARFDRYVEALLDVDAAEAPYTAREIAGLRLFIGKARCTECHNGPLFTNNEFHNTGVLSAPGDLPDRGRIEGVREVRRDPFSCDGEFSDDPDRRCPELRFARDGAELLGAVRTPSLRDIDGTAPFMHKGQLSSLEEVLDHYNRAPLAMVGHNEAEPLGLSAREIGQLVAFLETLAAPPATPPNRLAPPSP